MTVTSTVASGQQAQVLYLSLVEPPSLPPLNKRVARLIATMRNSRLFAGEARRFRRELEALSEAEAAFSSGRQGRALAWIIIRVIESAIGRLGEAGDDCIDLLDWEGALMELLQEVLQPKRITAEKFIILVKEAESGAGRVQRSKVAIYKHSESDITVLRDEGKKLISKIDERADADIDAYNDIQEKRVAFMESKKSTASPTFCCGANFRRASSSSGRKNRGCW